VISLNSPLGDINYSVFYEVYVMDKCLKGNARGRPSSHRMKGNEQFHNNGVNLGFDLLSFWQWFGSHLTSSAFRGNLAEYLVKQATGAQGDPDAPKTEDVRATWDDCDLVFPKTRKGIEVKSSAYLQDFGWEREKHSRPTFGIAPSASWNKAKGTRSKEVKRHSKVYVFCLLKEKEFEILDPMDVSQWTFWVVPTRLIDKFLPDKKTVGLNTIEATLKVKKVDYNGLREAVTKALNEI
jgi:ribosomal protein L36